MLALAAFLPLAVIAQDDSPDASGSPPGSPPVAVSECVEPESTALPLPPDALSIPEEVRIALFDQVWTGIRDFYIDPELKGLDWDAIGDEYASLIIQTDDAYQVYELLAEMVELLDDPYTRFLSPADLGDPAAIDPTYVGIGALVDSSAAADDSKGLRILYVFEGGSARDAGIAARDRIVAVDGDPCARIADIRGPEGTTVTLTVVSPGEEPRDLVVERRRIDPLTLPESRVIGTDPRVGYLRIPNLAGQEVIDAVTERLAGFVGADGPIGGLILDLRSTNIGAPGVVVEILRHFVTGEVGAFHTRIGDEAITVSPSDLTEAYDAIPIVVLVDGASEAEAEQIAAILQDQGRAVVIGQQTAGETHTSNDADLPDGSVLQVVSVGFKLPDGSTLEGQGVTPDILVDEDWLDYTEEEDPGILAALEALASMERPEPAPGDRPAPSGSPAPTGEPRSDDVPSASEEPASSEPPVRTPTPMATEPPE
jgi:C-terminal peptidase prc